LATAAVLIIIPRGAAAVGPEPTAITVAAPATAILGDSITLQARLVSAAGPIVRANVDFVVPTAFLHSEGEMVVARGVTDGEGLATADFEARMTGELQVKAVFHGDNIYAPTTGTAPVTVSGSKELYVPDIGIRLRGVNTTPLGDVNSAGHWLLSGWPIGALLTLIWSLYGAAVFFISRISADADRTQEVHP
jgi:hypothetical protein